MTAQYAVGDTITLTKGDDRLVREVERDTFAHPVIDLFGRAVWVSELVGAGPIGGWQIIDVKPKPAPLPETPGLYADKDGYPWTLTADTVNYEQRWEFHGTFKTLREAALYAPFVRLLPESDLSEKLTEARREARNELVNALLDHYPEGIDGYSAVTGAASWLVASFDITGASA